MRNNKTTKLIALTLSLLMLFTMIPLSVSAEGETQTILDVAIQDGEGNYYLNESVIVTATHTTEFTGTFDGRGFTVTTTVPLFKTVSGATIENLIVEGTVTGFGAVVCGVVGDGTTTFDKVTNKASVNNTTTLKDGGFGFSTAYVPAGGIAGFVVSNGAVFNNCVNEGAITADDSSENNVTSVGGIVGFNNYNKNTGSAAYINTASLVFTNCSNGGAITGDFCVGGILGRAYSNKGTLSFVSCSNTKSVTAIAASSGSSYVGGILGYSQQKATLQYCYNTAAVSGTEGKYTAGICGFLPQANSLMDGCYNSGTVTGQASYSAQIYCNSADTAITGTNYYLSNNGWACSLNATEYNYAGTAFDSAALASGELAYRLNQTIDDQVYYQNISSDAYPVLDSTHGYVFEPDEATYCSLRFYTLTTASIRLNSDGVSGLRFSTAVNKTDYDALSETVKETIDFGTIITPNDYLEAAGNDFTALTAENFLNVNSDAVGDENFLTLKGESEDYYYFCGSITGIKADNYEWEYSAIGYVTIGEDTVYSGQYATRSIAYVANAAYYDRSATSSSVYTEDVSDTEYNVEGKPYSPYTYEQLKAIKEYL